MLYRCSARKHSGFVGLDKNHWGKVYGPEKARDLKGYRTVLYIKLPNGYNSPVLTLWRRPLRNGHL
jgi:hypothetical protein